MHFCSLWSRYQRGFPRLYGRLTSGRIQVFGTLLATLSILLVPATVFAQDYTYAECDAIESAALGAEIEALARAVLAEGQGLLNVDAIVERQWAAVGMDQALDDAVELAVRQMMTEKPYWERFWSGWSGEKAEEFATAIAGSVFSSPAFSAKLDELSAAIAADITVELEAMAARSASTSLLCIQQYVGSRYSESLLSLFEMEIEGDVESVAFDAAQDELTFSQFEGHDKAALGAGIIVVSQLVRRISVSLGKKVAGRVAGRIAGRLLGRLGSSLIPFAGWVVGGGLILWDLYEGGSGSLPQIQESLQSEEVKALMRAEVALAIEEGLSAEIEVMAGQITVELMAEWRAFCDRHTYLCTLPEESTDFGVILDTTPVADLEKLSRLVDVFLGTMGRIQLDESMVNGVFEDLLALPVGALTIFEETESPDVALAWAGVAGDKLNDVAASQIYLQVDPSLLVEEDVAALLSLDEPELIAAYLDLDGEVRTAVNRLTTADRRRLLDRADQSDINWLFHHADDEGLVFSLLVSRVLQGRVTVDDLQAPSLPATGLPAASPVEGGPVSLSETVADEVVQDRPNSVFVGAMVLSVVLAISTFALVAAHVVKRRKQ